MELYSITRKTKRPQIIKPLSSMNGLYYAYEYDKENKKTLKIGIKCDEATHVLVKQHDILIQLERYDNDIWQQLEQTWQEGLYEEETDGIFGFNVGGDFYVQAWQRDCLLEEAHVAIIPQVFTIDEYRLMQQEVVQLIESFSLDVVKYNEHETIYLKRIRRYLYPLQTFEELIYNFITILEEIIKSPSFDLEYKIVKKHEQSIKRWTPKIILEQSTNGKDYLTIYEKVHSYNIREHKMIHSMLKQFLKRIDAESEQEALYVEWLTHDQQKVNVTITQAPVNQKAMFTDLENQIDLELNVLHERQIILRTLKSKILSYVEIDIFQFDAVAVEETHLFRMDVKYRAIYELYSTFEVLRNENEQSLQPFIKSLLKSPFLYELWIFLKLVEQFQHWSFNALQFIEWINTKYPNAEKLDGFDEIFELPAMPFRVRLMFNKHITNVNLKPDYLIGIQCKAHEIWQWHTADAKYKVYNAESVNVLKKDIKRSAVRYKEKILIDKVGVQSSVIIHPNADVKNWNIKKYGNKAHTISHFFVKAYDTSMLRGYFKRLLHHYGKFESICPTCNTSTMGTKKYDNSTILTYKCDNCSDVWVSSHCWSCKKEAGILYKYALDNYNYQVQKQWNVHCPHCHADANSLYTQVSDVLHETYHYSHPKPEVIKVYETKTERCNRCGGSGRIGMYRHIDAGRCYSCNGGGQRTVRV